MGWGDVAGLRGEGTLTVDAALESEDEWEERGEGVGGVLDSGEGFAREDMAGEGTKGD